MSEKAAITPTRPDMAIVRQADLKVENKINDGVKSPKPESAAQGLRRPVIKAADEVRTNSTRRELMSPETKESSEKPEIKDLGKAVAFFVEPPIHLSAKAVLEFMDKARERRIIISPTNEGRRMVGFIESAEQAEFLEQAGNLALGLVGDETSSFIHIDTERQVSISGCMSIIAAARAIHDEQRKNSVSRLAQDGVENAIDGYKGSKIQDLSRDDVEYAKFPDDLPKGAFERVEADKISTHHYSKIHAVKIDVNNFSDAFVRATKDGQIQLNQKLISFFNQIDSELRAKGLLVGEQTTDSLELYFTNLAKKRAVESILLKAVKKYGISIKAVGTTLNDVELTTQNGRVMHSTNPVEEKTWTDKEKLVKKALKDWAIKEVALQNAVANARDEQQLRHDMGYAGPLLTDEQLLQNILVGDKRVTKEELESHIFFRYSRVSDKLGVELPEAVVS